MTSSKLLCFVTNRKLYLSDFEQYEKVSLSSTRNSFVLVDIFETSKPRSNYTFRLSTTFVGICIFLQPVRKTQLVFYLYSSNAVIILMYIFWWKYGLFAYFCFSMQTIYYRHNEISHWLIACAVGSVGCLHPIAELTIILYAYFHMTLLIFTQIPWA